MRKAIVKTSSEEMYIIERVENVNYLNGTLTILYTDSEGKMQTSIYTQDSLKTGSITIL